MLHLTSISAASEASSAAARREQLLAAYDLLLADARAILQNTRPDPILHIFARPRLQHERMNSIDLALGVALAAFPHDRARARKSRDRRLLLAHVILAGLRSLQGDFPQSPSRWPQTGAVMAAAR